MRFVVLTALETILLFMTPRSLVPGYRDVEELSSGRVPATFQQLATRLHEVITQKTIIQTFSTRIKHLDI